MKNKRGITLIALVITIIILLILAGITITSLTNSGLFQKAQLAKEKTENSQYKENKILDDYENKIGEYINGTRQSVSTNVLWNGNTSSGTLELNDTIYNYDFLIIEGSFGGISSIVSINKEGMDSFKGGSPYAYTSSSGNGINFWAFEISNISDDGRTLTLSASGYSGGGKSWVDYVSLIKITGLKLL